MIFYVRSSQIEDASDLVNSIIAEKRQCVMTDILSDDFWVIRDELARIRLGRGTATVHRYNESVKARKILLPMFSRSILWKRRPEESGQGYSRYS